MRLHFTQFCMSIYLQFDFHDNWENNLRKQFSKNNFKKIIKSFTPSFETKVLKGHSQVERGFVRLMPQVERSLQAASFPTPNTQPTFSSTKERLPFPRNQSREEGIEQKRREEGFFAYPSGFIELAFLTRQHHHIKNFFCLCQHIAGRTSQRGGC